MKDANGQLASSEIGIANVNGARVLLQVFQKSEQNYELQKEILRTLREIFLLDAKTSKFAKIGSLKPFQTLFSRFEGLPTKNKSLILLMMEETLSNGELQLDEVKACCDLMKGK